MLQGLWTIGVKVADLEKELAFHQQIGGEIVLDESLEVDGETYRVPLVKMGDKYLHLAEKMVYEVILGKELPYGITHLVYITDDFDGDVARFLEAGATFIRDPLDVSAGFGDRRVAFFMTPNGWICEVAKIHKHRVPEVV